MTSVLRSSLPSGPSSSADEQRATGRPAGRACLPAWPEPGSLGVARLVVRLNRRHLWESLGRPGGKLPRALRVFATCRCLVETLSRFRPDLEVIAALTEIEGEEDVSLPTGVPRRWLEGRLIGEAVARGRFADVGDAQSLATLRQELASRAIHYGLSDLDAAVIQRSLPLATRRPVPQLGDLRTAAGDKRCSHRCQRVEHRSGRPGPRRGAAPARTPSRLINDRSSNVPAAVCGCSCPDTYEHVGLGQSPGTCPERARLCRIA